MVGDSLPNFDGRSSLMMTVSSCGCEEAPEHRSAEAQNERRLLRGVPIIVMQQPTESFATLDHAIDVRSCQV